MNLILVISFLLSIMSPFFFVNGECDRLSEFECGNTLCIPTWQHCNGYDDCGDNTDEMNCTGRDDQANHSDETVRDDQTNHSDEGQDDQANHSDETVRDDQTNRSDESSCSSEEFRCEDNTCVPISWRCDNASDCSDKSDEMNCRNCTSGEFSCTNGLCITARWRCDGDNDCLDDSDEMNCPARATTVVRHIYGGSCSSDEFRCEDNTCVPISWRCDNASDCGDKSDEMNCRNCTSGEFSCANGLCITMRWHCDTDNDCGDNSDEINCPPRVNHTTNHLHRGDKSSNFLRIDLAGRNNIYFTEDFTDFSDFQQLPQYTETIIINILKAAQLTTMSGIFNCSSLEPGETYAVDGSVVHIWREDNSGKLIIKQSYLFEKDEFDAIKAQLAAL